MPPKARIVAAGITCKDLAARARIHPSTLSRYLAGQRRCGGRQADIVLAFNRITRQAMGTTEFWGALWSGQTWRKGNKHG